MSKIKIMLFLIFLIFSISLTSPGFQSAEKARITFIVTIDCDTPDDEIVTLHSWAWNYVGQPVSGERVGPNRWKFKISRFRIGTTFNYYYCRNHCSMSAREAFGLNNEEGERELTATQTKMTVYDTVQKWRWWPIDGKIASINTSQYLVKHPKYLPRNDLFCGISLPDFYWFWFEYNIEQTLDNIVKTNATWVRYIQIITPRQYEPRPILVTNTDESILRKICVEAKKKGLKVYLDNWISYDENDDPDPGIKDLSWWRSWIKQLSPIILKVARVANECEAEIVGFQITPNARRDLNVYPKFFSHEGTDLIKAIRKIYDGSLAYWYEYEPDLEFYKDLDYFKLAIGCTGPYRITENVDPTVPEMKSNMEYHLQNIFLTLYEKWKKPLIFDIYGFSIDGTTCGAVDWQEHVPWGADDPSVPIDLQEQADVYEAVIQAISDVPWIKGIFSFAYYYCDLIDKSGSIRAKPAEQEVVLKWFGWNQGKFARIDLNKKAIVYNLNSTENSETSQYFMIRNAGEGRLKYKITCSLKGIKIMPRKGRSSGEWDEIEVALDRSLFESGIHSGLIKILSSEAYNSPQEVKVIVRKE